MEFILASGSPRRKEILLERGYNFFVIPSKIEEKFDYSIDLYSAVEKLALSKAQSVFESEKKPCLGCDTVVILDGKVLGKPKDKFDAIAMLTSLSGRCHEVVSAFAFVLDNKCFVGHDVTKVYFNILDEKTIIDYVNTGSPMDKAGAYGIQDGYGLVEKYEGSYYNVMGLPIEKIEELFATEEI